VRLVSRYLIVMLCEYTLNIMKELPKLNDVHSFVCASVRNATPLDISCAKGKRIDVYGRSVQVALSRLPICIRLWAPLSSSESVILSLLSPIFRSRKPNEEALVTQSIAKDAFKFR